MWGCHSLFSYHACLVIESTRHAQSRLHFIKDCHKHLTICHCVKMQETGQRNWADRVNYERVACMLNLTHHPAKNPRWEMLPKSAALWQWPCSLTCAHVWVQDAWHVSCLCCVPPGKDHCQHVKHISMVKCQSQIHLLPCLFPCQSWIAGAGAAGCCNVLKTPVLPVTASMKIIGVMINCLCS